MYEVNPFLLIQAENFIDEALQAKIYASSSLEKELTHRLISIQRTIQDVLLRSTQTDSWYKGITFPNPVRFSEFEFGQMKWATQSLYRIIDSTRKDSSIPSEFEANITTINELIETVARNEVNIVSLIDAASILRDIFKEAKDLNRKEKPVIDAFRSLMSINYRIEDILEVYLPLDYVLDAIFEEFDNKKVAPPAFVPAPAPLMLKEIDALNWDIRGVNAARKVHGVKFSDRMIESINSLDELINSLI